MSMCDGVRCTTTYSCSNLYPYPSATASQSNSGQRGRPQLKSHAEVHAAEDTVVYFRRTNRKKKKPVIRFLSSHVV